MLFNICLTNSYSNSVNVSELKSAKFLFELLRYSIDGNNIIICDDIGNASIQTLAKKINDEDICPEYQIDITEYVTELVKWKNIESDPLSQKKTFSIPMENNEDDEFLEKSRNANIIDAAIIDQKDEYLKELITNTFELIENTEVGLDLSSTIKQALKYSSKSIPKRNTENLEELKKIILDSSELNFVGYSFLKDLVEGNNFEVKDSILYLADLFISNYFQKNQEKIGSFNIITPMTPGGINLETIERGMKDVFDKSDSFIKSLKKRFEEKGAEVNLYVVERDRDRGHAALHTRGIFTNYCKIGTEWEFICYYKNGKVRKINDQLRLRYANDMDTQKIINLRDNPNITKKIKIF